MSPVHLTRHWLAAASSGLHRRLGWSGLAGLAALALALSAAWAARQSADEARQLRTRAGQAQAAGTRPVVPADTPELRAARMAQALPPYSSHTADLRRIFAAAQAQHIVLAHGEYASAAVEGAPGLRKLDVVLPLAERYPQVRGFVDTVLNALPNAALAELHAERPASALDVLETRLHLVLYYRGETP
jgi:hypothetical protein